MGVWSSLQEQAFMSPYLQMSSQPVEVSGGGGITVICTEMHRQRLITDSDLKITSEFSRKFIDDYTYYGYRLMADPIVAKMRCSRLLTFVLLPFVKAYTKEAKHRLGLCKKGSRLGELILKIGIPQCRAKYRRYLWRVPPGCHYQNSIQYLREYIR